MKLYCCGCEKYVEARLTDGSECYPHRFDLKSLPFWRCDVCGNFVGCHHKTEFRTRPLGCIPTQKLRRARSAIHAVLDPLWHSGKITRSFLYSEISKKLGREFHIGEIRSEEEVKTILRIVEKIERGVDSVSSFMYNRNKN